MDIHRLRCVVSLAKLGNVTRAAEACYIAQSTMSSTISAIEAELGVPLFVRTNRGITPTEAGECFAEAAEDIVARYDRAVVSLQALADGAPPPLTIGFNSVIVGSSIAPIMARFKKIHPRQEVRFSKHSISKLAECLGDGRADIVFGNQFEARRTPQTRYAPIAEAHPCVYVPKSHPLARRERIALEDLADETLYCASANERERVMSAAAAVLQKGGVPLTGASIVENEEAIISMVEAGLGLYPASTWYRRVYADRIDCVPLELDVENMQIVIAWRDPALDALAHDLAVCAHDVFTSLDRA